jgi:Uma2 family endonuclease
MPERTKQQGEFTYADFKEWPEDFRAELLDGVVYVYGVKYDVSRGFTAEAERAWMEEQEVAGPTANHQSICMALSVKLYNFLEGKPCKVFAGPYDVRLFPDEEDDDRTTVQPDITVVCDPEKRTPRGCVGTPTLVVEILSPSTRSHDKLYKHHKYQKAKVPEYWMVDPDSKFVEVFVLVNGEYRLQVYGPDEIVAVTALPGCTIALSDVFAE